jgi:hypothetical protein
MKRFIGLFPILILLCNGYVHHTLWVLGLPIMVFYLWIRQLWWTLIPALCITLYGEYEAYKNSTRKANKNYIKEKQIKIQSDHSNDDLSFSLTQDPVFPFEDDDVGSLSSSESESPPPEVRFPEPSTPERAVSTRLASEAVISGSLSPESKSSMENVLNEMIKVKIQSSHAPVFGVDFHTLVMMVTGSRHLFSTKNFLSSVFPYTDASVITKHLWNILENTFLLLEDLSRCQTFSQACVAFYRTFKILFGNEPWIYNFASNFIRLV